MIRKSPQISKNLFLKLNTLFNSGKLFNFSTASTPPFRIKGCPSLPGLGPT